MFSDPLESLRRNLALRLSFWYALLFTVSSGALFLLAYYLLAGAVGSKDHEVLQARLKEAAAMYRGGGVAGLRGWVRSQSPEEQSTMFIRLVSVFNEIAFIHVPPEWVAFRDLPDWEGYRRQIGVLRIPHNAESRLMN